MVEEMVSRSSGKNSSGHKVCGKSPLLSPLPEWGLGTGASAHVSFRRTVISSDFKEGAGPKG